MPRTSGVSDLAKNWRGFLPGGGENIFPNNEVTNQSIDDISDDFITGSQANGDD